jgi:hypothetical protein
MGHADELLKMIREYGEVRYQAGMLEQQIASALRSFTLIQESHPVIPSMEAFTKAVRESAGTVPAPTPPDKKQENTRRRSTKLPPDSDRLVRLIKEKGGSISLRDASEILQLERTHISQIATALRQHDVLAPSFTPGMFELKETVHANDVSNSSVGVRPSNGSGANAM